MAAERTGCLPVLLHRLLLCTPPGDAGICEGLASWIFDAADLLAWRIERDLLVECTTGGRKAPRVFYPTVTKATMRAPLSSRARIVFVIASLGLLLAFVFPLWKITLEAPQYPEGIGMYIRVNDVTGVEKHDLKNINGLNHYIGMKEIHPESIPELKIMPYVVLALVVLGLAAAGLGKQWLAWLWVGVFFIAIVVGMIDFWLWEYDYGHNLNPKAAISIEGMSYQPPLIGSKKLLNFTANSWPALGGWAMFLSFAVAAVAVEADRRASKLRR